MDMTVNIICKYKSGSVHVKIKLKVSEILSKGYCITVNVNVKNCKYKIYV